jgi:hypothetical protein
MEQRTREDVDRIKRERREANKQLVKQKRRMKSE